ncbi:MAG TPA: ABC transporter permease [Candidatus Polarisedimenticolia bacterium]|nr:ABC transporter permease [Candidatus Polarisedimenticolia bacterium]
MRNLLQEVRFGGRRLAASPGFTAVAVITLALGIGANAAVFSVVHTLLLRPLPYPETGRLVQIWETNAERGLSETSVALSNAADWKAESRTLDALEVYVRGGFTVTGSGQPERVGGVTLSRGLLELLGARPALGRFFLPEEDRPGAPPAAILGHAFWTRRFGGDPGIIGSPVVVDGLPRTVVGVLPERFNLLYEDSDLLVPMARDLALQPRGQHSFRALGRLAEGVSLASARAELASVAEAIAAREPGNRGWSVLLVPLHEEIYGSQARAALVLMLLAAGFVLLIACANVANLLLARGAARGREIAVRLALGAGRGRLMRLLLAESLLLALVSGTAGILVALWGVDGIRSIAPAGTPRIDELSLDPVVLVYMLGLSLATGVVFGLAPALQSTRRDAGEALKEGTRVLGGRSRRRLLRGLVVAEVALALVVLACGGLMVRSFVRVQNADLGFDPSRLLTLRLDLPEARYSSDAARAAFFDGALLAVRSLPGVTAAGAVTTLPLSGSNSWVDLGIEGRVTEHGVEDPTVGMLIIDDGYLETMGIPLRSGRGFDERDTEGSQPVVLVNETLARRHFPGEDPVGRRVRPSRSASASWRVIAGVVADVKHRNLVDPPRPEVYWPQSQAGEAALHLVVRTQGKPLDLIDDVRAAVWSVDPELPVHAVTAMTGHIEARMAGPRAMAQILGLLSGVALLLAGVGLYGVIAGMVSQRTGEIGVRVALGAKPADIVRLVLRQGLGLLAAGMGFGLGAALGITRLMTGLLGGLSPADPGTYAGIVAVLAAVAGLACWVPARRAARVDPVAALRQD